MKQSASLGESLRSKARQLLPNVADRAIARSGSHCLAIDASLIESLLSHLGTPVCPTLAFAAERNQHPT